MKKKIAAFVILSLVSALKCYCQVKEPEVQKEKVIVEPVDTDDLDFYTGDIDAPVDKKVDSNAVYDSAGLQVKPEFPGGMVAFYKYLDKNIDKTKLENPPAGSRKVFFYFVVEKDGNLSGIKVLRDPGFGMGAEVYRVLRSLRQKWEPGIQNGKPVRASYSLPITITIP